MTDRELLEQEAKSAGFKIGNEVGECGWWACGSGWVFAIRNADGTCTPWNSLADAEVGKGMK